IENSEDIMDARLLAELLSDQIAYRIRLYSYCICKSTDNYLKWLQEDYERKLRQSFSGKI
ncbi:MAG: DEAD/DEAH box helicase, partial [Vicingaceae bacterium]|nr:DEAD/DEAH box helicase [Vicingaceae bacterium]